VRAHAQQLCDATERVSPYRARHATSPFPWDNYRPDRHALNDSEMLAGQLQTTADCCACCRNDTCCLTSISRQAGSRFPAKMSTARRYMLPAFARSVSGRIATGTDIYLRCVSALIQHSASVTAAARGKLVTV